MYILSFKTGHDPAACLLENGQVVAAAEEERFIRIKHAAGYFPENAIKYCLSVRQLTLDQVDFIVFAREKNLKTFFKIFCYLITHIPQNVSEIKYTLSLILVQFRGVLASVRGKSSYQQIFKIIGGKKKKVYSFDHHLCHAASAYYGSGFPTAAILCMDGKGEDTSISMWRGEGGRIRKIKKYGIFDSLGYLYSSFTAFLGFWINDGEYKVMGMAPYGKPGDQLDGIFEIGDKKAFVDTRFSLYPYSLKYLSRRFSDVAKDYEGSAPAESNANLAATLQHKLELASLHYTRLLLDKTPETNSLCLAGGVALNVKMNKFIWDSGLAEKIWIQPAAGDMGNVLGGAWLLFYKITSVRPPPQEHLYLGPSFSKEDIAFVLSASKLFYRESKDVSKDTAHLLKEGNIVAWFQGCSEFGPRALGARSVLADPRRSEMKDIINAKVKFREPFRPFCPSFLHGWGDKLFENYTHSPYMIMSFKVKKEWQDKIPAVVHVDGTVRPQEVSPVSNPPYARLLHSFYEETGVPVVLNTSLNVKGEPIVNTPQEAIDFFRKTDVDYLVLGDFIASKNELIQQKN